MNMSKRDCGCLPLPFITSKEQVVKRVCVVWGRLAVIRGRSSSRNNNYKEAVEVGGWKIAQ